MGILSGRSIGARCSPKPAPIPVGDLIGATLRAYCSTKYTLSGKVENECGFYESAYGEGGKAYTQLAAKMALSQNIGVPWITCRIKQ
ncbi:beta-galactosidase 10 [Tanacetum coccineum]